MKIVIYVPKYTNELYILNSAIVSLFYCLPGPPSIMGLLSLGTPLSWEEAVKFADHVRSEGLKQFIIAYRKCQGHNPNYWTWGDEVRTLIEDG